MHPYLRLPLLLSVLTLAAGCSPDLGPDAAACDQGKCDTPADSADAECKAAFPNDASAQAACLEEKAFGHCEERRSDALQSSQRAFTRDAIRWAAADVAGVNNNGRDDRGAEYVEYFAMVMPPPEQEGGEGGAHLKLGFGGSSPSIELNENQIFALEDEPNAVVGQCLFTTWHGDIQAELPICEGSASSCPNLNLPTSGLPSWVASSDTGMRLDGNNLRMKNIGVNSNGAASDLAQRCMTDPLIGDAQDPSDPLHDDFTRGCMKAHALFKTEWRRSDSSICVAGGRLAECGCGVDTDGDGVADITDPRAISLAIVPPQPSAGPVSLRGFPMGTWSDAQGLPAGCQYVETGDDSQTVVSCDLNATEVLAGASDLKERCRTKYGNNVVVHLPVPADAIVCSPPADGQYADDCSATPWVVTAENSSP